MNQGHDMAAMLATVPAVLDVKTKGGKTYVARISNEIASGGEGRILRADEDKTIALKLYHPTRTPLSEARFAYLNRLDEKWFVKPKDLLFDGARLAGFTMKLLSKDYFVLQNLFQKAFCKDNGITLDIKLKVFRELIAAVKSAHAIGVVVGDLNQYNIMVTVKGDVKFLDVDSYETPSYRHSGILLEDIRDYYHGGNVTKNSDYFALSVILFWMACYVHPFKGIHARYMKIADRMLQRIPVFKVDPDLKVPKFYEPLKKGHLLAQFERMYLDKVERFIIDIDPAQTTSSIFATADLPKPSAVKKYQQEALMVQEVLHDDIENIEVVDGRLLVRTKSKYIMYDCSNKGFLSLLAKMERSDWDELFLGRDSMVGVKGNALYIEAARGKGFVRNTALSFTDKTKFHQNGHLLFALQEDLLITMDLNNIFGNNIDAKTDNVLGSSFNYFGGFFYREGQHQLFFSVHDGKMGILPMPVNIIELYQVGRVGMVKYIEKTDKTQKVINKYYRADGRNVLLSKRDADDMYRFAYQPGPKNDGFIFQPYNGYMRVIREIDFEELERHNLDICTAQTTIKHSRSGLILWEDDRLWLVNKK